MITNLINQQTDFTVSMTTMVVIIFAYYILATIVPVDKSSAVSTPYLVRY